MISICKRFHFDAAHYLPDYVGKCHNLHGHRWFVDVCVKGDLQTEGPQKGMVMDFGDLKKFVEKYIIERFDHTLLNEVFLDSPTAENLSEYAGLTIERFLPMNVDLEFVRVWETEDAYAEWRRE